VSMVSTIMKLNYNVLACTLKNFYLFVGLWVELPLLVQKLPEGWNLPSYLSITGQIANVGPLLYTILNSFFPKVITEKRSIYFVMIIGLISTILLSFFWDETTFIFGTERSTALIGRRNNDFKTTIRKLIGI